MEEELSQSGTPTVIGPLLSLNPTGGPSDYIQVPFRYTQDKILNHDFTISIGSL